MIPDCNTTQNYLHEHIPLSRAMEVEVVHVGPGKVILAAPLAPNINHRETLFGGSASAIAILAAWTLLYVRLKAADVSARLVIQRNSMEYQHAVTDRFEAVCHYDDETAWARFLHILQRKHRARLKVTSELYFAGQIAGKMQGEFVALSV